ncbi:CMP-N-acetylneuraminate-beta-galactosamide-alpha-2,3-sialyltransferase 1 isoform X3 [Molossus molossus]|uniref:CMP-N-acetylneuraminate-beta-galactosamide- alpha-2,3-sialyltransferase 1 isoform X3 n=1 Tax=Molossus molossus TaxID=27622 RepID=UPI001745E90A|nr:CMP-N-acetylneuraminate-beta-galactosamide-alpha-2,3-sialyltransferase 1 isoform X3 [Molossus molossus]
MEVCPMSSCGLSHLGNSSGLSCGRGVLGGGDRTSAPLPQRGYQAGDRCVLGTQDILGPRSGRAWPCLQRRPWGVPLMLKSKLVPLPDSAFLTRTDLEIPTGVIGTAGDCGGRTLGALARTVPCEEQRWTVLQPPEMKRLRLREVKEHPRGHTPGRRASAGRAPCPTTRGRLICSAGGKQLSVERKPPNTRPRDQRALHAARHCPELVLVRAALRLFLSPPHFPLVDAEPCSDQAPACHCAQPRRTLWALGLERRSLPSSPRSGNTAISNHVRTDWSPCSQLLTYLPTLAFVEDRSLFSGGGGNRRSPALPVGAGRQPTRDSKHKGRGVFCEGPEGKASQGK